MCYQFYSIYANNTLKLFDEMYLAAGSSFLCGNWAIIPFKMVKMKQLIISNYEIKYLIESEDSIECWCELVLLQIEILLTDQDE